MQSSDAVYINLEPNTSLSFDKRISDGWAQATLKLSNIFDKTVLFRIMCTNPKDYLVKPTNGSLKKDQTIDVLISMSLERSKASDVNDKFLVRILPCPESQDVDAGQFQTLWSSLQGSASIQQFKLSVKLNVDDANSNPLAGS